ncbi:sugar transporter 1 [Perilla frutescens var. frutescens]|nr:sugar transporter 1 [Perilla frutescens var. frutescens]
MAPFLKKFFPRVYRREELDIGSSNQYCKFDDTLLTLFTSSLYLAALVASLVAAPITKKMGRKWSMVAGGLLFLAGALLNGAAQNVGMLIIGRVLLGFGVGFANQEGAEVSVSGGRHSDAVVPDLRRRLHWLEIRDEWGSRAAADVVRMDGGGGDLHLRGGICLVMGAVGVSFLRMLCVMKFILFAFFACFVAGMTIFIFFLLPETKGIPIEDVATIWKSHPYWKRFVNQDEQIVTVGKNENGV